ncbi:MAG: NAD(P)H-dependent flavin oxidoreductase [Xanthobacteraceae bacterium]
MAANGLLQRLGLDNPIVQGPMGGGHSTPELVAAVCNAGGRGSLGCPYMTPEQITADIRRTRELTEKPFAVNLFAGGHHGEPGVDPVPMLKVLGEAHARLGLPAPVAAPVPPDPFPAQFEAVLKAHPAIFSFTFGIPARDFLLRLRLAGIGVLGTATTVEEARRLQEAGVDGIVAQGEEAGAHRGTFAGPFEQAMVPTRELVRGICAAVDVPVIAAGGLMDGADIAAVLKLGAVAVQLGTAFMPCPECGTPASHKQAILTARADTTVITRAFSGRPARGLANGFIAQLQGREDTIPRFPFQNNLTRPMRAAAAKLGETDYQSLWAGRGVARARQLPAADLVHTLIAEIAAA